MKMKRTVEELKTYLQNLFKYCRYYELNPEDYKLYYDWGLDYKQKDVAFAFVFQLCYRDSVFFEVLLFCLNEETEKVYITNEWSKHPCEFKVDDNLIEDLHMHSYKCYSMRRP